MKRLGLCSGSYARPTLSVAQEIAREAKCPECHRLLRVRPVRTEGGYSIEATIPAHRARVAFR